MSIFNLQSPVSHSKDNFWSDERCTGDKSFRRLVLAAAAQLIDGTHVRPVTRLRVRHGEVLSVNGLSDTTLVLGGGLCVVKKKPV